MKTIVLRLWHLRTVSLCQFSRTSGPPSYFHNHNYQTLPTHPNTSSTFQSHEFTSTRIKHSRPILITSRSWPKSSSTNSVEPKTKSALTKNIASVPSVSKIVEKWFPRRVLSSAQYVYPANISSGVDASANGSRPTTLAQHADGSSSQPSPILIMLISTSQRSRPMVPHPLKT